MNRSSPLEGYRSPSRESIVEPLIAPENLEGAAAGAIIMRDNYLRAISIFESHICEISQRVGGDMIRSRYNKLTELAELIVVIAIRHIAR